MSAKQLLRLAMLLAAVVLLTGVLALVRRGGIDAAATFALPRIEAAQVDSVSIATAADTIALARAADDTTAWRVNGHVASGTAVQELLDAIADTAVSGELVAQNAATHARMGVDSADGRRVRVVGDDGKVLTDLIVGDAGTMYGTSYVRRVDEDAVYRLRSTLRYLAARPLDDWRDKRIAKVEPDSVATIEVRHGRRGYTLRRDGSAWRFASGGAADSFAVAGLLSSLSEVTAVGFASAEQADSADFAKPDRTVRALDRNGNPVLALAFDSTTTGFWVRADSGGTVYELYGWNGDQLTPADSTLRAPEGEED